jgi:hypothetical protein
MKLPTLSSLSVAILADTALTGTKVNATGDISNPGANVVNHA